MLTGKFNRPQGPGEETRSGQASGEGKEAAAVVMKIAAEIGRTPSQVAINWVRQQSSSIVPILGARRLEQIEDNLRALDFTLTPEQLQTLAEIKVLPLEYPHSFWNDYVQRELISGERVDRLDTTTWPINTKRFG